jgi:hypothetical protein
MPTIMEPPIELRPTADVPVKNYMLLEGSHYQKEMRSGRRVMVGYSAGEWVPSREDLCAKFNVKGFPPKFQPEGASPYATPKQVNMPTMFAEERVETPRATLSDLPTVETPTMNTDEGMRGRDTYDLMTEKELRDHAAAEEIDITGCTTIDQMVDRMRTSDAEMVAKLSVSPPEAKKATNKSKNGK